MKCSTQAAGTTKQNGGEFENFQESLPPAQLNERLQGAGDICQQSPQKDLPKYVLALDVGTTTLKCHVYDQQGMVKGTSCKQVVLH